MTDQGSKGSIDAIIPIRIPDYDIEESPPIRRLGDGRSVEHLRGKRYWPQLQAYREALFGLGHSIVGMGLKLVTEGKLPSSRIPL